MTYKRMTFGFFLVIASIGLSMGVAQSGYADDDWRWGEKRERWRQEQGHEDWFKKRPKLPPIRNKLYSEECGACHMTYQPGWLPARSWRRMMAELDNHFGDNAELEPESRKRITEYLTANAADVIKHKRSRKIIRSLQAGDTPMRISKLPCIRRKHHEIPRRLLSGNPEVRTLANCQACHIYAEAGVFEEHMVRIPGYGRWDD
jgi:hypothetical protein